MSMEDGSMPKAFRQAGRSQFSRGAGASQCHGNALRGPEGRCADSLSRPASRTPSTPTNHSLSRITPIAAHWSNGRAKWLARRISPPRATVPPNGVGAADGPVSCAARRHPKAEGEVDLLGPPTGSGSAFARRLN